MSSKTREALEVAVAKSETAALPTCEKSSQVGNAAKMRYALKYLRDASREFHHLILNSKHNEICDKYKYAEVAKLSDAIANANFALSSPARNCDLLANAQDALATIHNDRCYVQNLIDDILREMRKDMPRVVDAKVILRNYADRIEAAVKALEADRDNWRLQALAEEARANAATCKVFEISCDTRSAPARNEEEK